MQVISNIFDFLTGFGSTVMMPIIIMILGLIMGAKFGKALRSGITVGIGFIAINLVTSLFFEYVGPAANAIVENWGKDLATIDVGWTVSSAIAYGTDIGSIIFVIGLAVNVILLVTRLTKTVDVDIWNYWHWAFTGSLVYVVSGKFWLGIVAAVLHATFTLIVADRTAPIIQKHFDWPDISISQGFATASMIIVWPLLKLWDLLGWKNTEGNKTDMEKLRGKLGIFAEPVLLGLIIGIVMGCFAYIGTGLGTRDTIYQILNLGMAAAATLFLLPRAVAILMEGLIPVSEQAREWLQKKFAGSDRKFYIGMDSALLLGDETTLTVGMLLVPITLGLAVILPGNKMLPFGDLASMPFFICMIAPFTKGDFKKTLVTSIILMVLLMYMGSIWAPVITATASGIGYAFPEGAAQISGFANPFGWICVMLAQLFF